MKIIIPTRKGQNKNLIKDYQRLYDEMAAYQLAYNVPPKRAHLCNKMAVSYNTLRVWLMTLQDHGYTKCINGSWIVCGLEYIDKRNWQ